MRRSDATKLHSRGRPPVDVRRDIVRDLMEAAEAALARKSAGEITIREIAEAAGADDAMIHYYFGGKDGLMISLIRDVMKNAPHRKSEQITRSCIEEKSVKPLVISLVKHYYSRPNLLRLIVVEFSSESSRIRSLYKDDTYADKTLVFIREIMGALRDAGIVENDLTIDCAATALIGMIMAPIILFYSEDFLRVFDKIHDDEWINYIARAIDSTLKSGVDERSGEQAK